MKCERLKISDFSQVITGGTPSTSKKEYWENGSIPWLNSGELNQNIIETCENKITELGLQNSSSRIMPPDTVLIALTGTTTGVVGYLTFEACANQSVTGILPSSKHHPKYLYYYLKSIRSKILEESYGGAQKHISQGYVKDLEIPLPPLETQKRIAEILDAADALRQKDQELLKKYDELAQAIFIDMFGDISSNSKNLLKIKLGELGKWQSGGTPPRNKPEYFSGNIPWLSSGELNEMYISDSKEHITETAIKESSTRIIEEGSLLLGMYDTAALKSTITTKKMSCNQAIAYSKLDNKMVNTVYVYSIIQIGKEEYKKLQRGVRQKNLNLSIIKNLEILLPEIKEQNKFADLIATIERQKTSVLNSFIQSEALFNSYIHKAFNGKII